MVTKLAGPFSDTCRFSTSPRSRLRLRPARRAALTMTLIRAECSMISAQDDPKRQVRTGIGGLVESFERGRTQGHPRIKSEGMLLLTALQWVPRGCGGVKADHLVPSHL